MCHVPHVMCKFFFFNDKVVELVGGGSVINGANPSSFNLIKMSSVHTVMYSVGCTVHFRIPIL